MTEPVLIVHGVNNHESAEFTAQVAKLQQVVGPTRQLVPVFWGDLGGRSTDLADCLPIFVDGGWQVRAKDGRVMELSLEVVRALKSEIGALDNAQRAEIVGGQVQTESLVRSSSGARRAQVRDAVADELSNTRVLQHIDDAETLAIVGRAIDAVLRDLPASSRSSDTPLTGEHAVAGDYAVRGDDGNEVDTRSIFDSVKRVTGHVMHGIDDALGHFLGNQLGKLNQNVRERLAKPISATLGDIMAYQRQPDLIQERLRQAIEKYAPGYGTQKRPISLVAHSLGGVIAFDAAIKPESEDKKLWIRSFVTFGSQAAFFHIVDPRIPLPSYRRNVPVKLPPSIGSWINLWDPLDLLAFTAGTVFRLADGSVPADISVRDSATELIAEKGWAHSVYWESDELATALRRALL
jgi:hypothetical protein